ncbi:MAG: tail fiber protein [Bacteroidota bacterium]
MNGFIGEVRMFGGNFAPRTWAFCNGQLLSIAQNTALFSILGTTYGGDGRTTFALPDLRGRVPLSAGTGPGLSAYRQGQRSGLENVTLNILELPNHTHSLSTTTAPSIVIGTNPDGATTNEAEANTLGVGTNEYNSDPAEPGEALNGPLVTAPQLATQSTGNSMSHDNIQPTLVVNYVICLQGIFPSRS